MPRIVRQVDSCWLKPWLKLFCFSARLWDALGVLEGFGVEVNFVVAPKP